MDPSIEATPLLSTPAPKEVAETERRGGVQRRHDLDALRGIAMLLGIVLHAALSFAPIPWSVSDTQQSDYFLVLFAAIHGFRMPLFFLISGFFTAMLWRKRGFGGLVKQRFQRIFLPLVIGCLTIVPSMWAVGMLVSPTPKDSSESQFFDAVAVGDSDLIGEAIDSKALAIDALHPGSGATLLTVATFYGHPETVQMILNKGADVNQANADSGTALHVAVFMGRAESAKRLVAAGANLDAKDASGKTPKDNLKIDFGTTNFIAKMYGLTLDEDELKSGRAEIAQLLGADPSTALVGVSSLPGGEVLYGLLFQFPIFMHLWFLAFLCWLVAGFAGYAFLAKAITFRRLPKWLFCSSINLFLLVPLTMIPQSFMTPHLFGPDASIGLLPIPSVLGYYAIFFFFGVIYWDLDDRDGRLGRRWYVMLPLALLVVLPIGLEATSGTFGFLPIDSAKTMKPLLSNFFQALFVWLMVLGSIGMFRALFWRRSKTMRYVSDSSYWLYLAHLPLVVLAQCMVKDSPVPAMVKFVGITVVVSALLLLSYEYLIRYTIIGSLLNGPREPTDKTETG